MWKEYSQRSTESRVFSTGTPISSHRESWQGGGVRKYGPTVISSRCCGDPALVAKLTKKKIEKIKTGGTAERTLWARDSS